MDKLYSKRYSIIRILSKPLILGLILIILSQAINFVNSETLATIGCVLTFPFYIYASFVCLMHWKDYYNGNNSGLWGISFFALSRIDYVSIPVGFAAYFLWHVAPDMKKNRELYNNKIDTNANPPSSGLA